MIKIIKHGIIHKPILEFTCSKCRCVFEADDSEWKYYFARNDGYYKVFYPECKQAVYRKDEN